MENPLTKFRPILFSTPMVQAIQENRKRQTRRTKGLEKVNENPDDWKFDRYALDVNFNQIGVIFSNDNEEIHIPFKANIGDVLWVRETFYKTIAEELNGAFFYKATIDKLGWTFKWKPSIFMPKSACRIFLKVKSIRVERLQDISEEDIKNEGVQLRVDRNGHVLFELGEKFSALFFSKNIMSQYEIWKTHWAALWCKINGFESWKLNPFVFVYEFEQIEKPKNFIL